MANYNHFILTQNQPGENILENASNSFLCWGEKKENLKKYMVVFIKASAYNIGVY